VNGPRGGFQARGRGGHQQQNSVQGSNFQQRQQSFAQPMDTAPIVPPFPTGVCTNPISADQMQNGTPSQPQVNPMAFVQAMAFMATPAGMQTMAAFSNMVGGASSPPQHAQASPPPFQRNQHQLSPQLAKRKVDKFNRNANYVQAQQTSLPTRTPHQPISKPPRAKAIPSPAVPGFGFALPTSPTLKRPAVAQSGSRGSQKKRKVHLGLTQHQEPQYESSSSSSDEVADVDEEAALAEKIVNKGLVFEHEGHNISLQTPAEIKAWIKDRRRQYPTAKRVAEKSKELAEKRAGELEFLRRIKGDTGKRKSAVRAPQEPRPVAAAPTPSAADIKSAEERQASHQRHQVELQQLRKRLHESLAINKAKAESSKTATPTSVSIPQAIDLGLGYASENEDPSGKDEDEDEDGDDSSELEESSVVSSSSDEQSGDSDLDSDSPPEEQSAKALIPPTSVLPPPPTQAVKLEIADLGSDSDSPPEEISAKIPIKLARTPLPPQQMPSTTTQASNPTTCKSWERYGRCNHKKYCKLEHPPKEKKEKKEVKKLGLFERLVEQEREQADRLALEGIKWLGQNGFLG
jgi:hypothetical protein